MPPETTLQKPPWAARIYEARKREGLDQSQLAERLGVTQKTVSRWETGEDEPQSRRYMDLGRLFEADRPFFWEQAGIKRSDLAGPSLVFSRGPKKGRKQQGPDLIYVPRLAGAIAAGDPRPIDESEVEEVIPMPREWTRHPDSTVCLRVKGDSMSPLIEDGYLIIVDTAAREPGALVNEMVAAVDSRGDSTVKWLRLVDGEYMLLPQHTSPRLPPILISRTEGWRIAGRVLRWIGQPPPARGKRS